ncbi:DUF1295 domain-containing protein [Patescibacteria group bacterium]|nr:DUF1295 domain-containing protein [Patescibacteria group bacterium]
MDALALSLAALLAYMGVLFIVSLIVKNNGVADIGYGIAFMVVVAATFAQTTITEPFILVIALLPFIWGARLATRIYLKNTGKPEDFRYKAWRDAWGKSFVVRSFLQVYLLQGLVVFIVSLPITLALLYPSVQPNYAFAYLGLAVWVVGFFFEVVADHQLDQFIKNPQNKGSIMMRGLWRYSRHPNYFGESTMWVGIALMSLALSSIPFVALVSPLLITFLLLKVSGVPLLEKRWEGDPAWETYKKRTSVFIPLPPQLPS